MLTSFLKYEGRPNQMREGSSRKRLESGKLTDSTTIKRRVSGLAFNHQNFLS